MEDGDKLHTINPLWELLQLEAGRKKRIEGNRCQMEIMIGQNGSRGKLSAALGSDGFINRMWEKDAAKMLWATRAVRLQGGA